MTAHLHSPPFALPAALAPRGASALPSVRVARRGAVRGDHGFASHSIARIQRTGRRWCSVLRSDHDGTAHLCRQSGNAGEG